jgi:hypothetical protein
MAEFRQAGALPVCAPVGSNLRGIDHIQGEAREVPIIVFLRNSPLSLARPADEVVHTLAGPSATGTVGCEAKVLNETLEAEVLWSTSGTFIRKDTATDGILFDDFNVPIRVDRVKVELEPIAQGRVLAFSRNFHLDSIEELAAEVTTDWRGHESRLVSSKPTPVALHAQSRLSRPTSENLPCGASKAKVRPQGDAAAGGAHRLHAGERGALYCAEQASGFARKG